MRRILTLSIFLFFCALQLQVHAAHLSSSLQVTARCNASNEVPAVIADGLGLAVITINDKRTGGDLYFQATGLTGPITAIHIHEGQPDENGGVVLNLTPFLSGNSVRAVLENTSDFSIAALIRGDYYLNIHTDANPGGEIRGQFTLESDILFAGPLTGLNEMPPVVGGGVGFALITMSSSKDSVNITAYYENLTGAVTGAHLHLGAPGTNGSVVSNLTDFVSADGSINAFVDASTFATDLLNGMIYLNIHTDANSGGELRANLMTVPNLAFDCVLSGNEAVPVVPTDANGLVSFQYDMETNTLSYDGYMSSTGTAITAAHLHAGELGVAGGVLVNLSDDVTNGVFAGSISDPDASLINAMLSGGVYLNVHTEDYPAGEIRGQVYKLAREGYFASINGGQEVPPVSVAGSGIAMASIDRDQTNAHVMMVVDGLESDFTATHLHSGGPGTNGGVIFNLTPAYNNGGAFTYWKGLGANAPLIRTTGVYVNVHTTDYPGGELRGNFIRGSNFNTTTVFNPNFSGQLLFTGRMTAGQEVPASGSTFTGVCGIMLNEAMDAAYINMSINGLEGEFAGVHLHQAIAGENGDVLVNLTDHYYKNRISAEIPVDEALLAALFEGQIYINIHSTAYPGGELRAQLPLEKDLTYGGVLSGDESVPVVETDAAGLVLVHITQVLNTAEVSVTVSGLSGPITAAHLHMGAEGENGDVVVNLSDMIDGMSIKGSFDASAILSALNDELVYINIHTEANPGGEIRAQLFNGSEEGIFFDGELSGAFQTPANTSTATGIAAASYEDGNLAGYVQVNGLSGPITAAHLHAGELGVSGGVLVNLMDGIDGNVIDIDADIDEATLNALLKGNVYVNIHTAAYPAGEVRAQLYGLFRDGYVYDMCAAQETHDVVDAPLASGGGIASLDRKNTNLHLMAVVSNTSDELTGLHIHDAPVGADGAVVLNLTPNESNGGAFLYYTSETFSDVIAPVIAAGNGYLNAHTTANAAGELRGQIVRTSTCPARLRIAEVDLVDPNFTSDILITSRLSGGNEVPAVTTDALGVATVNFNADMTMGTLNATVSNLSSNFAGAHIHDGAAGENGGVLVNFSDDYEGGRITADFAVDADLLTKLVRGEVYLNVHTDNNPGGEVRGQLGLEAASSFSGTFSGDNEVPAVTADGNGIASLHYTAFTNELEINIQASQLTGSITGIHLHNAAAGENGDVVENLTSLLVGNTVRAKIQAGDYISALRSGNIYVNIHTEANPGGEIRAQLMPTKSLIVDSWLTGSQLVPEVDGNSIGLGLFDIDLATGNMSYSIVMDNLTGDINAAHLHQALLGENGDVAVNLSDDINGNWISNSATTLTSDVINNILSGNIYVNVHTGLFPAGEVRGQLYRVAREGYAYDVCQAQEVTAPMNSGDASGSGMFAFNRDMDEAHLMVVANNLSSDFAGSHVHNAPAGSDGDVILNFTDFWNNNGAFFYFTEESATPFDAAFAEIIRGENAYVNIHTANNPAGELRGQIVKTPNCPYVTATVDVDGAAVELSIYPNPVTDRVNFKLDSEALFSLGQTNIAVMDNRGSIVKQQNNADLSAGINMGQMPAGIYYVQLQNDKFTHTFKVVKY